ncbi:MAG TPA: type II secretion system protein [Usitatibacter sp.]|nr:type II secretion system protein [Usitatibacter sp.]
MRTERGFTLIEVLVAFVLLSLVLATGFEIFSTGLRRAGDLEGHSRAVMIAQTRLASAGLEEALREGVTQGESEDGKFHWTLDVKALQDEVAPGQPQPGPGTYLLYRIEAKVDWAAADTRPRSFALATLGIGTRQ